MRKIIIALLVAIIYHAEAKTWPNMMVRRSQLETLLPKNVHTLTDCMHVTSEDGIFTYRKIRRNPSLRASEGLNLVEMEPNEQSAVVCGVYFVTDPDKIVEVEVEFTDVSCELGGLLGFVDGWELNGEYFPNVNDHELSLEQRVYEFCDKTTTNPFLRKTFRKRKFISNQNGAVFQYKIPYQGSFAITVRYVHNPKPCNIMAEGVAPYYVLQNYGTNRNCSLSALFPAVISILALDVGTNKGNVNYDCDHSNEFDKVIVGGSSGLDSSSMTKSAGACGKSDIKGPEQAIFCGVTTVRLESSGKHNNKVYVSLRQADENDLSLATAVCDL